jgi:hypothetical protein
MYAVQQALASSAFTDIITAPAWRSLPSWYLVAQNDEAIRRTRAHVRIWMGATTVESVCVAMVSHPDEVVELIEKAAASVGAAAAH